MMTTTWWLPKFPLREQVTLSSARRAESTFPDFRRRLLTVAPLCSADYAARHSSWYRCPVTAGLFAQQPCEMVKLTALRWACIVRWAHIMHKVKLQLLDPAPETGPADADDTKRLPQS